MYLIYGVCCWWWMVYVDGENSQIAVNDTKLENYTTSGE